MMVSPTLQDCNLVQRRAPEFMQAAAMIFDVFRLISIMFLHRLFALPGMLRRSKPVSGAGVEKALTSRWMAKVGEWLEGN